MDSPQTRMRRWRESEGLTYAEVADRLGCHRSLPGKLERGDRLPGRRLALQIERLTEARIRVGDWDEQPTGGEAA